MNIFYSNEFDIQEINNNVIMSSLVHIIHNLIEDI